MNNLINAKNNYQTFDSSSARALIYQKYLLSDSNEAKIEFLFLLEDLFKKDNLINVYSKFFSDNIKEIGIENLPDRYQESALSRIVLEEDLVLGKVKYNDKIYINQKYSNILLKVRIKKKFRKILIKFLKN